MPRAITVVTPLALAACTIMSGPANAAGSALPMISLSPALLFGLSAAAPLALLLAGFVTSILLDILRRN